MRRGPERVRHDTGIPSVVAEYRKLSILSYDTEPCRVFILLMQNILLSGSRIGLQDCLDLFGDANICLLVGYRTRSFPMHLMRNLCPPAASTESAIADVTVFSMRTISIALVAELVAGILSTGILALTLSISVERPLSVFGAIREEYQGKN